MVRIRTKIKGLKGFTDREEIRIKSLSKIHTRQMAVETEKVIKNAVAASVTRANSTGNLADNINAEEIIGGWGVGNIDLLNASAPYWLHVNYGSEAIGADWRHRVPNGSFQPGSQAPTANGSGQRWTVGGNFSFIPKKPIAPLNYIAKTLQRVPNIIRSTLRRGRI